jgi:two-component system sensor histidine kinase KdpD
MSGGGRPDPDALLRRVEEEERRAGRGRLTLFFGAAPGVGKTYAMLLAGRQERDSGRDVVVGLAETHGRAETARLLEGLETLPRRSVTYRGIALQELDLDGVLARRPALVLVDELAHSNAPGSRHVKRWQDVEELLGAGIDVFATLNVQHLESLSDVVAQITGVTVRERLPDSVLEEADEVRLVDLTPDELLERLAGGKVYVADLAQRAVARFFRKGNLIALREMALRRTAARVDAEMRRYREAAGIEATWAASERLLVCLSWSPHNARVIRSAARIAGELRAPWLAVYVDSPEAVRLRPEEKLWLSENLRLAEQLGAEVVTLAGGSPAEAVLRLARERNATKILAGKPRVRRWRDRLARSFVDQLIAHSGDVDVYVTSGDPEANVPPARRRPSPRPRDQGRELLAAGAVVAGATAFGRLVFGPENLPDVAMLYLLGVVLVALRLRYAASLFAAVLSVLGFDFFFVPPFHTFHVSDLRHVVTFAVLLAVAVVISELMRRLRHQADTARERERRTAALYELSGQLASAEGRAGQLAAAARQVGRVFEGSVSVYVPGESGELELAVRSQGTPPESPEERGVARWVWSNGREAGRSTDTLPGAKGYYLPLATARGRLGVMGIAPRDPGRFEDPEQRRFLGAFAAQMAVSLERDRLGAEAAGARLESERERLRSALLSSVSHDLRTPLAAIEGSATALLDGPSLGPGPRHELLVTIREEAERLGRRVRNLLDMTRLEAGAVRVRAEWQPLEEVVGAALAQLERRLEGRPVEVNLGAALPMVSLDAVLIEQVLVNLLENALKCSPPGSPLEITAGRDGEAVTLEVADRGCGIPPGEEERIFDKFHQPRRERHPAGVGLGLAICRAIVQAHGGSIAARNRPGGGAAVRLTLPQSGAPPELPHEVAEAAAEQDEP